jgi:hypothetical protein
MVPMSGEPAVGNPANIEALARLLHASEEWDCGEVETTSCPVCRETAEFLASRGVLVPSSLTDGDAQQIAAWAGAVRTAHSMGPHPVVAELERIARGEP